MKRVNVDLIVGASILTALFILVAGMLWLKEASLANKMVNYLVVFPEVGTLQLGDPVYINGVKKGTVSKIELRGTEVGTILNIDRKINMTDSVRVAVVNVGLLGERGIGVTLSPKGRAIPHITAESKDTAVIRGRFDTGISEAMGMLGTVLSEVETLVVNVAGILDATLGDTAFITQFHSIVGRLDTVCIVANRLLLRNEPVLNAAMTEIKKVSGDLKTLINKNSPGIDSIVADGGQLMTKGIALVAQAESLVVDVQGVLRNIEGGKGSLGKLYTDESFYRELKETIASVDTLVNEVQKDALKLRVRLGFGKKKQ
ncbi:MAG: MlaD family protein [Chitinispirillales bacterium]|nr:MlaD family protein [Chitinispirillales bacterium]